MADMAKGMKINKSIIEMGKGFSVKRVCMMAGGLFTKKQILEINASLNKIKKSRNKKLSRAKSLCTGLCRLVKLPIKESALRRKI